MSTIKAAHMSFFNPLKILLAIKTISVVIVLGTLVAAVTPTKSDDAFMAKVRKAWIGLLTSVASTVGYNVSSDICEEIDEQLEGKTTTTINAQ